MSAPQPDPLKRHVSLREVLSALLGVAALLVGFAVAQLYSKTIGALIAAPVIVLMLLSALRLSREQKQKIAAAMAEQEKKPFWHFVNIIQLAAVLALLAAAVQWLYGRL